jgi:4-hydroxybenzoate polyprenyltransferase
MTAGAWKAMELAEATSNASGRRGLAALVEAMRPEHWVKNLLVLLALVFGKGMGQGWAWLMAGAMFAAFCLASSAIYLINDLLDRPSDRAHPVKRNRAIASGRLAPGLALVAAVVLLAGAAGIVIAQAFALQARGAPLHGLGPMLWTGAYVALNLAYSLRLKSAPVLDVLIIALGFVLRAMAGAVAIAVPISPWLVACSFTICLFIALTKRRNEVAALGADAPAARKANAFYTLTNLDHMLAVSSALAITTYSIYCLAPRTLESIGSAHLIWTVPVVIYAVFRYYCLVVAQPDRDPVGVILRDRVLWLTGLLWLLIVVAVIELGPAPALKGILQ